MTARALTLGLTLALALAGCVRAGFGVPEGADIDGPAGTESGADQLSGPGHPNDTCASPLAVDLNQLPAKITIDTANAENDLGFNCCGTMADIVLRLENVDGDYRLTCTGGDLVAVAITLLCPPLVPPIFCQPIACDGTDNMTFSMSSPPVHMILCRDPTQTPAVLSIDLQ
jgi:hypothetical protein